MTPIDQDFILRVWFGVRRSPRVIRIPDEQLAADLVSKAVCDWLPTSKYYYHIVNRSEGDCVRLCVGNVMWSYRNELRRRRRLVFGLDHDPLCNDIHHDKALHQLVLRAFAAIRPESFQLAIVVQAQREVVSKPSSLYSIDQVDQLCTAAAITPEKVADFVATTRPNTIAVYARRGRSQIKSNLKNLATHGV